MFIEEKRVTLKNGQTCVLRSPRVEDAEDLITYMKVTAAESSFLLRYPEEITMTKEGEETFIRGINEAEDSFMIIALVDDKHAGNCSLSATGSRIRIRHRCNVAIALYEEFCGLGVGTSMLELLLEQAKTMGFEQVELEVVARNERAIALYQKIGFEQVGCIPTAMRHKDGTYDDLLMMVKKI